MGEHPLVVELGSDPGMQASRASFGGLLSGRCRWSVLAFLLLYWVLRAVGLLLDAMSCDGSLGIVRTLAWLLALWLLLGSGSCS